jgi:hypothetical protein
MGLTFSEKETTMYDPTVGRFISRDPVAADANLYRYAGNNPSTPMSSGNLTSATFVSARTAEEPQVKKITATDIGVPIGGNYGKITKLGPYAGPDRLGWGFQVSVETNVEINKCSVTQKVFSLDIVKDSQGKIQIATVKDAGHPEVALIQSNQAVNLTKQWEGNKQTYTPDGVGRVKEYVKLVQMKIIRSKLGEKFLEYNDFPGYPGAESPDKNPFPTKRKEKGVTYEMRLAFEVTVTGPDRKARTIRFKTEFVGKSDGTKWEILGSSVKGSKFPVTWPPPS